MTLYKKCNMCFQNKPLSDFYAHKKTADRRQGSCKICAEEYRKNKSKTKKGHLQKYLSSIKLRAKEKNVPFDLDNLYLESIATTKCPVFDVVFDWGLDKKGQGRDRPSLDRIIPELGYVKGNVCFISFRANSIKNDATETELYAVADWLHEARKKVLNAQKITTTPVPTGTYPKSEEHTKHGTLLTPGIGEDDDHPHHHCGTIQWEDLNNRPETSSGDSVAHRNKKVEPLEGFTRLEDNGDTEPEIVRLDFGGGRLFD